MNLSEEDRKVIDYFWEEHLHRGNPGEISKVHLIEIATRLREQWEAERLQPAENKETGCFDCGRAYGDKHGFPDLIIPDDVWLAISPTGDFGGLLCPSCICKRVCEKFPSKTTIESRFMSGPFANYFDYEWTPRPKDTLSPRRNIEELGPITPPEPELPKCPWCGHGMVLKFGCVFSVKFYYCECKCGCRSPREETEAAAIAAARGESDKQWEAERLQPTPGPPDLEGVPDDTWILWSDGRDESIGINRVRWIKNFLSAIKWHIPLGPITPPEPKLPECPSCGFGTHFVRDPQKRFGQLTCDECWWESETFKTKAEAIAAARKAGE